MLTPRSLLVFRAIALAACAVFSSWLAAAPPAPSTPTEPPEPRLTLPGQVVGVVDGDTVDFEVRLVVRVRLLAGDEECWAPESRTKDAAEKKLGLASTDSLKRLALGRSGSLSLPLVSRRLIDYMTLERLLGNVWVDGQSLGAAQVRAGHASTTKDGPLGR